MDQVCPRCKTTKYRNPNMKLMVNVCGHNICETCVELLFVKGSGACPECNIPLRRTNFRLQLFEDANVDKEVDIRRRILKDFNKQEEDFESLREYNDYLEMVEDIIFNLTNNLEILETNKKIQQYKDDNKDNIMKNRSRLSKDALELLDILSMEEKYSKQVKLEMKVLEDAEKVAKIKNKEKLIDDLMFGETDANQILEQHREKVSDQSEASIRQCQPIRGLHCHCQPLRAMYFRSAPRRRARRFSPQAWTWTLAPGRAPRVPASQWTSLMFIKRPRWTSWDLSYPT